MRIHSLSPQPQSHLELLCCCRSRKGTALCSIPALLFWQGRHRETETRGLRGACVKREIGERRREGERKCAITCRTSFAANTVGLVFVTHTHTHTASNKFRVPTTTSLV